MGWRKDFRRLFTVGLVASITISLGVVVPARAQTSSPSTTTSTTAPPPSAVTGLIVEYEPGIQSTEAPGVATGSSEVTDTTLLPGQAIGFGFRTVRLADPVSVEVAQAIAAELERADTVKFAEPDYQVWVGPPDPTVGPKRTSSSTPTTTPPVLKDTASGEADESAIPKVGVETVQPSPPWGLDRIDQRALPLNGSYAYGTTGIGVTAYIVDSGIRPTHNEFTGRVGPGFTAIDDGNGTNDCNGHGTHVAGTVGGTTYGVAKEVTLVPVRVFGCAGGGSASTIISGLNWIIGHHGAGAPAVANMSLGGPTSDAMDAAVNATINDGVTVVVASGNDADWSCFQSPARVPAAITVNASTTADDDADFSNYGSCSDLYAPGVGVLSAYYTSNTATETTSGTSMASPHVAGVAARLLSSSPGLTSAQVWSAINSSTTFVDFGLGATGDPNKLLYAPRTVPGAPTGVSGVGGNAQVAVGWVAPASDGGSAITRYTVTASPGGATCSWSTGPLTCTVSSLTNGTPYTFTVKATNALGTSAASAPSAATTSVSQPDVQAKKATEPTYLDLNQYLSTATATANVAALGLTTFNLRVQNDGNFTQAINVKYAAIGLPPLTVTVKDGATTLANMTTIGKDYTLAPGATKNLVVIITATTGSTRGAYRTATFTALSRAQTTKTDKVAVKATRT